MRAQLAILEYTHDDGTRAVRAGMLSQIVGARELLTALVALKRLIVSVE